MMNRVYMLWKMDFQEGQKAGVIGAWNLHRFFLRNTTGVCLL